MGNSAAKAPAPTPTPNGKPPPWQPGMENMSKPTNWRGESKPANWRGTKEEFEADFKPIVGAVEDGYWCGTLKDLFSPDDTNPDSRRFIDQLEFGVLSISADTGGEKWGRKFDPTTSINPTLTEAGESNQKNVNFESKIPADAPEELKAQVANGALRFTVTMGWSLGKKVLKWNGVYNGQGGPFLPAGGDVPASDCDNFWEYV